MIQRLIFLIIRDKLYQVIFIDSVLCVADNIFEPFMKCVANFLIDVRFGRDYNHRQSVHFGHFLGE